jgi:predicted methyltransferase
MRNALLTVAATLSLAAGFAACATGAPPAPLPPPTAATPLASSLPPGVRDSGSYDASADFAGLAPDAGPQLSPAEAVRAAVGAPDRDERDRALDAGRHPAEMLAFFGIAPGMRVAELIAGGGYTTELLARVVGERGTVFAENPRFILDRFAATPWNARLAKTAMKNVARVDRELDDPLPAEATNLDAVLLVLSYHDTVWMKVDRARMNQAVFTSLKHGGVYGIVDHSARAGAGTRAVETLHRIDEKAVIDEVTKAGFKLAAEADFLRNPDDKRDWNDSPLAAAGKRGTSDRFVLKFVKP